MEELKEKEQLTDAQRVIKLTQENAYLRQVINDYEGQLVKLSNANGFKRIELLIKLLDHSLVFPDDFIQTVIKEIVEAFGFNESPSDEPAATDSPEE